MHLEGKEIQKAILPMKCKFPVRLGSPCFGQAHALCVLAVKEWVTAVEKSLPNIMEMVIPSSESHLMQDSAPVFVISSFLPTWLRMAASPRKEICLFRGRKCPQYMEILSVCKKCVKEVGAPMAALVPRLYLFVVSLR